MQSLLLWLGAASIIFATITDYYDGKIARRLGVVSSFGKLMDPLADKIIVMAGYVVLVEIKYPGTTGPLIPSWIVVIILAREFFVTGLRQIALERNTVIEADRLGKHKTGWQLGLLIGITSLLALRATLMPFAFFQKIALYYDIAFQCALFVTLCIVLTLTICSGFSYFYKNRHLININ